MSDDVLVEMVLDELDMADHSLTRLLGLYDHKNARSFVGAETQTSAGPYNECDSMLVSIIEAGGDEAPDAARPSRRPRSPSRRSLGARRPRTPKRSRRPTIPKRIVRGADVAVDVEESDVELGADVVSQGSHEADSAESAGEDDPDERMRCDP
jgi:hypothetical protein